MALIGYQTLHGERSKVHQPSPAEREASRESAMSVAVTPLAIPILAGAGTGETVMNYASTGGIGEMVVTIGVFAALCFIVFPWEG